MSAMLLEKSGRASRSSRTKHTEIVYFFIQDRIEKGDIGLEYCNTDKMVAEFMTNSLQGKKIYEFRNRIMGMPNGENIAEVQKVRDEINPTPHLVLSHLSLFAPRRYSRHLAFP